MYISLDIHNLHVSVRGTEVLHGIDLVVPKGEVHAIMGPNGSGKSTLSMAIAGHPAYEVTQGTIQFKNEDIATLSPDKRANLGIFLAFQQPQAIPGVRINTFLKQAVNSKRRSIDPQYPGLKIREYRELLQSTMERLHIKPEYADRYLNDGFSGGEKKKVEILQLALLQPDIAILDEIDSGLDVDALKVVADGVNLLRKETGMGVLIITHYPRILNHIQPDVVHVLMHGKIIQSGSAQLAHDIETRGYDWLTPHA